MLQESVEPVLELCQVDSDDMDVDVVGKKGWRKVQVTVDSGAANSVINGDEYPKVPREESAGSRKGQVYLGPGSEKIPNRGQKKFKVLPGGHKKPKNMTFQDAKVRKPLAAVSGITGKDNIVLFDKKGSFIAPSNCPEVEEIRRLIQKIKDKIALEEKNGVYIMPVWIQEEVSDFIRPGGK